MRFSFLSISLLSSAKQQREITKFEVLWITLALGDKFSFFSPKLSAANTGFISEGLPNLCHIKKLEQLRRDRNNVSLCFCKTFSLPFPSSLLKLPNREFKKRGRVESETRPEVTFSISDEKSMRAAFSTRLGNAT